VVTGLLPCYRELREVFWRLGKEKRRPMKRFVLAVFFVAGPLVAQEVPSPEAYRLRGEYEQWYPNVAGLVLNGTSTQPGTELDLKNDLGVQDKKTFQIAGALQFHPGHKLWGSYTRLDYNGDANAQRDYTFGHTTYAFGTHVLSTLRGSSSSAGYEWDFVRAPTGYLGLVLGAKLLSIDGSLVAPDLSLREDKTFKATLPVLGLAGSAYVGKMSFSGEASGFTLGKRGNLYELAGMAHFHLSDRLAIGAGYRFLHAKSEVDFERVQVKMSGWQFAAQISI
jgi:hypothetical protein